MTTTFADQAATTGQNDHATDSRPSRPVRRTFTAACKADAAKPEARNDKLAGELGKTRTALDIAGKAFALLENISSSADSDVS
ncbi:MULTISPECIES: hypothetical protein [Streptosporangium]|uniref:Uncharacterized protein n=1 Tax=Streptosporangium brasiliense TaxID=47480 RepID=A0ABT9RG55_9ACTN|nr:hypothetical protein [Streptosporangium brasiliense]MDP9867831.1 hypothetical protein [Streptosporangium brasiliense]